jgi:hypothetical protein
LTGERGRGTLPREQPSTEEVAVRLLCRIGFHKFHRTQNEDGEVFLRCDRCSKEDWPSGTVSGGSNLAM